jgi:hypothetical protein
LPSASVARTSKVWVPSASVAEVKGVVQSPYAAASRRHWNVEFASVRGEGESSVALSSVCCPQPDRRDGRVGWCDVRFAGVLEKEVQL